MFSGVLSPRRVGVEHQPARERDFDAIFRGTAPWKQDDKRPSSPTKSRVLSPTAESPYKQVQLSDGNQPQDLCP